MMINDDGGTVIDFGNVTRLNEQQQKEILIMPLIKSISQAMK